MLLHFSPALGAWSRCKATNRPGPGVTLCPRFTEHGGHHIADMTSLAALGGGQIYRNGRVTTVTPNTDGTFTVRAGKLTRVYGADGNVVPLRARLKSGWTAAERRDAENQALKALVDSGAYQPDEVAPLSGVGKLDRLRRMNQYDWANLSEDKKAELISAAFTATAMRFDLDAYDFAGFEKLETTGQTTFYVDNDRRPVVALSSQLLTTLSNRTATDAIARQVAHLVEGRSAAHGPAWQARVRDLRSKLGLDIEGNPFNEPHRKSVFEREQTALYARNSPFSATCAAGKHSFYRRSLEGARSYCGDCYREAHDPDVTIKWGRNPDAGKWVMTPNGLKKVARVPATSKAPRGRKIESLAKLPPINSPEDLVTAKSKMSDALKDKLTATDQIAVRLEIAGGHTHLQRTKRFTDSLSWYEIPTALKSGYEIHESVLAGWREANQKTMDRALKAETNNRDHEADYAEAVKLGTLLDAYAPDPERVAFIEGLRNTLIDDDESNEPKGGKNDQGNDVRSRSSHR